MTIAIEDALKVAADYLAETGSPVMADFLREEAKLLVKDAEIREIAEAIMQIQGVALGAASYGWQALKDANPNYDGVESFSDLSLRKQLEYYRFAEGVIDVFRQLPAELVELSDMTVGRVPTEEDERAAFGPECDECAAGETTTGAGLTAAVIEWGQQIPPHVKAVEVADVFTGEPGGYRYLRTERNTWLPAGVFDKFKDDPSCGFEEGAFSPYEYPLREVFV